MGVALISIVVSALALAISTLTAWFTLWRRGDVRMTQPAVIFLGPDGSRGPLKIFLRALIFSTAERGHVIEHLFVRLRRGNDSRTFPTWIMRDGTLSRGSGLFVHRGGIVCDHHFLLPPNESAFEFSAGEYVVEVYAACLGRGEPRLLSRQTIHVTGDEAEALATVDAGIFFNWNPEAGRYTAHVDRNRAAELNHALRDAVILPRGSV